DPFGERNQVRRSEQPHAQSGPPVDALQHGAGRTFAVRSRHMNKTQCFVRLAGQPGQLTGVLEAKARAEELPAIQEFNGFGIGHRGRDTRDDGRTKAGGVACPRIWGSERSMMNMMMTGGDETT